MNVDCKQTFSAFLPRHLYLFYLLTMLYPVLKKTEIKKEEERNYTTNAFVHMRPSGQTDCFFGDFAHWGKREKH